MFGFKSENIDEIIKTLSLFQEVEEALIFGSRAKGNYKQGSDVDIVLKGAELTKSIITDIAYALNEESLMPYHFDIINYHTITNTDLIEHIASFGKSILVK